MDQSVNVNGTLRLSCNVSGSEPISYQWLKDGVPLQDDGRVSGSTDSMLMVEPVEGNDFGGYQCNASNDVDQVLSEMAMVAGEWSGRGCVMALGQNQHNGQSITVQINSRHVSVCSLALLFCAFVMFSVSQWHRCCDASNENSLCQ